MRPLQHDAHDDRGTNMHGEQIAQWCTVFPLNGLLDVYVLRLNLGSKEVNGKKYNMEIQAET